MPSDEISNKTIYELLQKVVKKTENIENQSLANTNELKQEIRNLSSEIKQELEALKCEVDETKTENRNLKTRLREAERKLKKYNLIFYGIEEKGSEFEEIKILISIINDKLGINCNSHDIRDYHRIGQKVQNKYRPLVIEVVQYHLKLEILSNGKKLRGTGISVSNDYIVEDYQQRKVLRENLKIARDNKFDAFIKKSVLIVNGERYTYEDLKKQPVTATQEEEEEEQEEEETDTEPDPQTQPTPIQSTLYADNSTPATASQLNKSFKDFINVKPKIKRRKEHLTESENPQKRSTRLMKVLADKR